MFFRAPLRIPNGIYPMANVNERISFQQVNLNRDKVSRKERQWRGEIQVEPRTDTSNRDGASRQDRIRNYKKLARKQHERKT